MATWSVNSYGYPNPFQTSGSGPTATRARGAWEMFESFTQRPGYASVKAYWENHPSRPVKPHGVESWKATFEEFGLLYVLSGSDNAVITPGGRQLLAAVSAGDEREFAWIALNLLLRYPLRGEPRRRSRGDDFDKSDLLLYWYLHASLIELDGFWQQELFRILAYVFRRSEAPAAVDLVRQIRAGRADITQYPDPSGGRSGGVYNALNQVLIHGSLNHMLFTSSKEDSQYLHGARENWWYVREEFRDLIELALGGQVQPLPAGCATQASLVQRMPSASIPPDEQAYFDYVGAQVTPLVEARARAQAAAAPMVDYGGDVVFLLSEGQHFRRVDDQHINGPLQALCVLADGRRVIVSDDLERTFMVEHKELTGDRVVVRLRPARPITDREYVVGLLGGGGSA